MTPEELEKACRETIDAGGDVIVLTVPFTARGGYTQRLFGYCGPRGEIVCVNNENQAVCRFSASAVLKALKAQ